MKIIFTDSNYSSFLQAKEILRQNNIKYTEFASNNSLRIAISTIGCQTLGRTGDINNYYYISVSEQDEYTARELLHEKQL